MKRVRGNAVFLAAIMTQAIIIGVWFADVLPYLWLNLLGCVMVILLSLMIESARRLGAT